MDATTVCATYSVIFLYNNHAPTAIFKSKITAYDAALSPRVIDATTVRYHR